VTALADIAGADLGRRVIRFDARDAALYAIAVGAGPEDLDLVWERRLRVLPAYACALGLWAVEAAGELGAYDRTRSLHAGQGLVVHRQLRPGAHALEARVAAVWDKGRAAVVEIEAQGESFDLRYTIFLPGAGGFGGDRGPAREPDREIAGAFSSAVPTRPDQALLYRLTGDLHPVHVDPELAASMGFARPILHGLCTLGIAARVVAGAVGAHPAELRSLDARLVGVVLPGDVVDVRADSVGGRETAFVAAVGETIAIAGGRAGFGPP
jgi:acyl dehydratase